VIQQLLDALGADCHREGKIAEGYRVKVVDRRNRALLVRLNKGPEDSAGETNHLDT
jgi:hypothetical protein